MGSSLLLHKTFTKQANMVILIARDCVEWCDQYDGSLENDEGTGEKKPHQSLFS